MNTNTNMLGSAHVSWMFELTINDGRDADFRVMAAEMAEATLQNEPGTLDYEWYVSESGRDLHLFERYENAEAALIHMGTFGARFAARFFDILTPTRITLLGAVDERISGGMKELAPQVLRRSAGFSR
ncbi:MAG: antibiotic biosynthesis monooxygenase [Gemmatimonadaceae bacterium]